MNIFMRFILAAILLVSGSMILLNMTNIIDYGKTTYFILVLTCCTIFLAVFF
ncbi:hypothetical protein SAMN05444359_10262 [Neolewinella agarilytica]|uniref:NADH dehydrogenase subunit 5 n=1 Tax=Neolewinella agarilytica TaxID=478744 RepID=A0A1H9ADV0_9BACT|nr:hypothetical protein SAMN05444359_10262 [Neolewinella agarilytica]